MGFAGKMVQQAWLCYASGLRDIGQLGPVVAIMPKEADGFADHLFFASSGPLCLGSSWRLFFAQGLILHQFSPYLPIFK